MDVFQNNSYIDLLRFKTKAMIIIPVAPVPKPRITKSDRWKKRKCVTAYWQFKDDVRLHIQSLPEAFKVIFYIEMPASWSEKKKTKFSTNKKTCIKHFDTGLVKNVNKSVSRRTI